MFGKKSILIAIFSIFLFVFSGCEGESSSFSSSSSSLNGVAQKGAFLKDSSVSLCKLDEKMECTSDKLEVKVTDDNGSYEFSSLSWSGLSRLSITGFYFDEVSGAKSLSPATITAIVDIESNVNRKNVNILTDLQAKRMKKLVDAGKSTDDAKKESKENIKQLFSVSSDDFTELDLLDFSAGKASVNAELLRISAAIAKSTNPVGDLEKLMEIYNKGGLAAVLDSSLYIKLMKDAQDVDVKDTLLTMGATAEYVDNISSADIKIAPFARARISTYDNTQVMLTLFGTKFNTTSPSLDLSVENGDLSISNVVVSTDKKSAILTMNETSACKNMNITFTVANSDLEGENDNNLQSNTMLFHDPMTICNEIDDTSATISFPPNELPLAIIGTQYTDEEQEEINITVNVGEVVPGLESSLSHDRDPYPFGGITHCKWENESGVIIKESNDNSCDLTDLVFNNPGIYDYTLTVTDKVDVTDSNVAHITVIQAVVENTAPEVTITPSTNQEITLGEAIELDALASDVDVDDVVTLQWTYQKDEGEIINADTIAKFTHTFDAVGEYKVSVVATDSENAKSEAFVIITVIQPVVENTAPTISISPAGDKTILKGDTLLLKSSSNDADGDALTISWKLKNVNDSDYTTIENFGETGFKYIFDTVGTYLVVAEVQDTNAAKAEASITVTVKEPIVTVTLQDINLTVAVKGNDSVPNFGDDRVVQITQNPLHGTVEAYLVGNEVPYIKYTSTDCFIGTDSFIYKSGNEYGHVNITITDPSALSVLSETKTLYNTDVLTGEFLRAKSASENVEIITETKEGVSSLTVVGNEIINYNYDPEDSFVGNDFFEYTVSETINECSYSQTGRIDFVVESLTPIVKTPTKADFRTLLLRDNPKDKEVFGSGIAIEGGTVAVGVPGYLMDKITSRGEVVIYQKTENGAEIIQNIQDPNLENNIINVATGEGTVNREFGWTVSLKDGFLAVVAPGFNRLGTYPEIYSNFTKVYIYKQEENNTFTYIQTFDDISNDEDSNFAYKSIAINKNYLVIGANYENVDGKHIGAAYIYPKTENGFAQTPIRVIDTERIVSGGFANKVALMNDLVLVTMSNKKVYEEEGDTQRYGAVYVYKDNGSGIEQVSVINSPKVEVDSYAYTADFGASLAVDGNMLAIGIPNATVDGLTEVGYVDIYMRSGDEFTLFTRLTDETPVQGENFGKTVAIENPYLIVSTNTTSNSDNTKKEETVQVYQYSGEDPKYAKLDEFEHIPTYRRWLSFQERASFGANLDISNGIIVSSASTAFNFSKLETRSYEAGQVYLFDVDIKRPYWFDYKPSIIRSDDTSYYTANIFKPENMDYSSSGAGTDSGLFTYDMNSISYGIQGNIEECYANCEEAGEGEGCFITCEEENSPSQLDFYTPMDANGDNKYEVDMKLSYDGKESIYPLTWEVKDKINVTEGHNDGLSYFHYDYNRLLLEGVRSRDYASELLFEDEKAYVRSDDSIFIYNKNLNIPELLEYDGKISISDVPSENGINTDGVTSFYQHIMASFDVEGSRIATMSTHTKSTTIDSKTIYETDSYIHLFNNKSYVESIVVHRDNQNIYPCEDDRVCDVNHKNLSGVQLENGMVFAGYHNHNTYHNGTLVKPDEWEVEREHGESGVMIYKHDGTSYSLVQTIEVPARKSGNSYGSSLHSFRADGNFLLINGSHSTDNYDSPNRYIRVYKFDGTEYSLLQSFDLPTSAGTEWTATLENGYVLIENQRIGYTNLDTYIYKYNENDNNFVLIDTITNEEAGATYKDGFTGVHIQVEDDGDVYLYKRFYKRLETRDAITDVVGNAAYIGVFKQDEISGKFRFVDSFTHRDGSNYTANSFAIDGDIVISNTITPGGPGHLHSFKLVK